MPGHQSAWELKFFKLWDLKNWGENIDLNFFNWGIFLIWGTNVIFFNFLQIAAIGQHFYKKNRKVYFSKWPPSVNISFYFFENCFSK